VRRPGSLESRIESPTAPGSCSGIALGTTAAKQQAIADAMQVGASMAGEVLRKALNEALTDVTAWTERAAHRAGLLRRGVAHPGMGCCQFLGGARR
jgi:hypothetical protein